MNKLTFKLNIRPMPHQSVRFGRNGIKYKPKKIVDYQNYVRRLVQDQLPEDFFMIPSGADIHIKELTYEYEYPKSWSKKRKQGKIYKTTKPDLQDNLNKAFLDSLEGLVYEQDQNIVSINNLQKVWSDKDRITLTLEFDAGNIS
jgi:Holliday junction resolvase RusA-like endonuclease